ncbi:ribonuclease H-like domain-containing protein, partial [Tanacetum coccineum]
YDLKCREIKINNLNLELEKVVKERDELKLKIEKWDGSSKNLTKILNSQMSTHDKNGLGFGTQMDDLSNKSKTDSENSLTVFEVRSSDEESTLANNRLTKSNEYHDVPPPITGNPLTPRSDISFAGLDEYAFRNKIIESETTETNKTVDDENDVCAVKTVSSFKPNVTQAVRSQADKSGQTLQKQGIGFKKVHKIKACFVCKSTGHLIKDCDFYDQKSHEPRVKNMVNIGKRVVTPVWDYGKRVNHQKFSKNLTYPHPKRTFSPSAVLTRAGLVNTVRLNVSTARSISTVRPVYTVRPVSTARFLASKIAQSNSVIRPSHPRLDNVRPKASNSPIKRSYNTQPVNRPKDLKTDVKTFGVKNITTVRTRAVVSKGKVEHVLKKAKWVWRPKGNPEILLQDHAVVDSGCSSHMTGNKAYLSEYEDFNGGFVAFGSDPKGEDQGRKIQDIDNDPLVSLVRESMKEKSIDFVTPTKASGEAQEEEISPTILEAAKTLSKVASHGVSKERSTNKGKRYRRRVRSMAKKIDIRLDDEEEINTGREEIHTGIEEVSTSSTKIDSSTASKRGQREGKAPMVEDDI